MRIKPTPLRSELPKNHAQDVERSNLAQRRLQLVQQDIGFLVERRTVDKAFGGVCRCLLSYRMLSPHSFVGYSQEVPDNFVP